MFGRLLFDDDMLNFLYRISPDSIVAATLLNSNSKIINEVGNFIKSDLNEIDVVSYLPKSKYKKADEVNAFSDGIGRVNIKIGRFASRFLLESAKKSLDISNKDIEEFVNLYKSYFSKDESRLKVVEGEEIMKFYSELNYLYPRTGPCGTLWNSCMRQVERNEFMKLYAENINVKMLVFFSEDGVKIRSRALLWDNIFDMYGNEYKVMDRIYSVYDHDVNFFKEWAKKNGYIFKAEQNAKSERSFMKGGKRIAMDLYVDLKCENLKYFPYLDTFKFFDKKNGRFSNSENFTYQYILVQSNGGLEPPPPPPEEDYDDNTPDPDQWDDDNDYSPPIELRMSRRGSRLNLGDITAL